MCKKDKSRNSINILHVGDKDILLCGAKVVTNVQLCEFEMFFYDIKDVKSSQKN